MLDRIRTVLDRLSGAYFQTDDHGRVVYYPWGMFGGGLVVPTRADRNCLGLIHTVYLFGAVAIGVLSTRLAPTTTVAAALVHIVSFVLIIITFSARLPKATAPFDHHAGEKAMAAALGKPFLAIYLTLSIGLTVLGLVILAHGELWIGGQCVVVFAICTAMAVRLLRA